MNPESKETAQRSSVLVPREPGMKGGAFALSSPATGPPQTLWTYLAGVLIALPDLVVAVGGTGVDASAAGEVLCSTVVGAGVAVERGPGGLPLRRGSAGGVSSATMAAFNLSTATVSSRSPSRIRNTLEPLSRTWYGPSYLGVRGAR